MAIANYGLSYGLPGKAAPASPPRLPPIKSPVSPAGKRVVYFTPRQLQQLAEQLETVTKAELKVRCFRTYHFQSLMALNQAQVVIGDG